MGLIRNLAAHEIADQVLEARRYLNDPSRPESSGARQLTNIVLMGMGEPLANYRETVGALARMTDPEGMGIPPRRITVSTVGMVPQIRKLGESGLGVQLAVSLNATTDGLREKIMPAAQRLYPLGELMEACRDYPVPPRRHLTFEYVLLSGLNDAEEDARRLVKLVRGIRSKINLIPFNEFPEASYERPPDGTVFRFQKILSDAGLPVFVRRSRGRDILAACGQLRTEAVKKVPTVV
jgi:23S rRNA (adenine2503-C2)-methyltransferase